MEHTATQAPTVSGQVRAAINASVGSVRAAAIGSGIPYTTLDRRLRGDGSDFTVAELRRLGEVTGHAASDFEAGSR